MLSKTFRKAVKEDIPFLVESIIEAEKSGTDYTVYEKLLNINKEKMKDFICFSLNSGIKGCELSIESHMVCEVEGRYAGSIAFWVEGLNELFSANIKANLIHFYFKKQLPDDLSKKFELLSEIEIKRTAENLQIESIYIRNEYRGNRLVADIIDYAVNEYKKKYRNLNKAQIISVIENESSKRSFLNAGFSVVLTKETNSMEILNLFPGTGKILWEKEI